MQKPIECAKYWHLQDMGGLELLKARYHHTEFSKHVHEGYCIGVIEDGAQSFYRNGTEHVAPKGDIILVNADEIHTGSSAVESGWGYRAIYPTPEMFESINQDYFSETHAPWFPNAVVHDPGLASQLVMLFDVLQMPNNTLFKESLYLSTMAYLQSKHGQKYRPIKSLPSAAKQMLWIKDYMASHAEDTFSLEELAGMVDLSPWYFLRQFREYTGMTPHHWHIQAKLHMACRLLKQGIKASQVALDCGFSDQSHFNRHFKRTMGLTPLQYVGNGRISQ